MVQRLDKEKTRRYIRNSRCGCTFVFLGLMAGLIILLMNIYMISKCVITGYDYWLEPSPHKPSVTMIMPYAVVKLSYDSPKAKNIVAYSHNEYDVKKKERGYRLNMYSLDKVCDLAPGQNITEDKLWKCYDHFVDQFKKHEKHIYNKVSGNIGDELSDCHTTWWHKYPESNNICRFCFKSGGMNEPNELYHNGWCNEGITEEGTLFFTVLVILVVIGTYALVIYLMKDITCYHKESADDIKISFIQAVNGSRHKEVKKILEDKEFDPCFDNNRTIIVAYKSALKHTDTDTVKVLLNDTRINPKQTEFADVIKRYDYLESIREKIRLGSYDDAFILAVKYGHVDIVKSLIEKRLITFTGTNLLKAYLLSARYGHVDIFEYFLNWELIGKKYKRRLPLIEAATYGHINIVKLLLCESLDPSYNNNNAVVKAIQNNHVDIFNLLIQDPRVLTGCSNYV